MVADYQDLPFAEAVSTLGLDKVFSARATLRPYEPAEQAIARIEADPVVLRVMERTVPTWRDSERRKRQRPWVVRHYAGDAAMTGPVDLDGDLGRDDLAGIVVDGDLTIAGLLVSWEPDTRASFIVVRGCLRCEGLLVANADVIVGGNLTASRLVAITDGHAWLDVGGNVAAPLFIMDSDGFSRVRGQIHAKGWSRSHNAQFKMRKSDWPKEIRPEFREEFLDEDGYPHDHPELYQAILEGRDILRVR
jgi:hypothetical protein